MSRLAPLDKALVLILVPLWLVCFALSVKSALLQIGVPPLYVHAPAEGGDYPTVAFMYDPSSMELEVGDRLLRVGETDLRGMGPIAFTGAFGRQTRGLGGGFADAPERKLRVLFERGEARRETAIPVASWVLRIVPILPASLFCFVVGVLLLWRAPGSPTARALSYALLCTALGFACFFSASPAEARLAFAIYLPAWTLVAPLTLRAFLRFPEGGPSPARWARFAPWVFVVWGPLRTSEPWGWLLPGLGTYLGYVVMLAFFVTLFVLQTRNFRRADPVGRRQMKWVVLGVSGAILPPALMVIVTTFAVEWYALFALSSFAIVLVPLSVLIAVLRYDLFDIDRLISATASYNILLVLLLGAGLVVVPRVAEVASAALGIAPAAGQVAFSLLLAAVVVPAHRRLRPQIERVLFKERYALDRGIAELLPTLSACQDARALTERAGEGLNGLLRPEACVVYAAIKESYAPVFVEGRAVPPAFEAMSPLVGTLRDRRAPLALGKAGRRPDEASLGPFDRAALETLQAEVVVPVRQDDALAAFVCLGPKRSGDVYTSTDLSLLAAVAETVSRQLQRFDQEEVTREAQAMQESLRRYVPGAVAEQLSSGAEMPSGEREVSVLFVDLRGYTGFAESRRAEEIFSTVNRYTETVSQIVQKHAGSVVEFNGDGMMAVFGAPRELAHKERAAVEAGREIVDAVSALPIEPTPQGREAAAQRAAGERSQVDGLSVGVGIATGEAFVGNIQAVDRMIWSAIGNTTNLAARLQSLTRDVDAALVIDPATWERTQPAAAGFEKRPDVPIRGRRETQDVYVLPMPARS